MSRSLAEKLGAKVFCGGQGKIGDNLKTTLCYGVLNIKIGLATLNNVPLITNANKQMQRMSFFNIPYSIGLGNLKQKGHLGRHIKGGIIKKPGWNKNSWFA